MHDYIIRGGTIFDGDGSEGRPGDVAVRDGRIVSVGGSLREPAKEVIDADGAIVAPAWVDVHTHYDGQATWDSEMNPSASHGVGTIVMGNCGVGFAPVPKGGHRDLIELMEGVEDIPGTALYEGMPWGEWETYPEYLDFLATRRYALNVSSMIAHGAVRNYVMGSAARSNAVATNAEIGRIAEIVEQAVRAGAVGFSTSRIMGHTSIHGDQVPGTFADEPELSAIAGALKRAGAGVFQIIPAGTLGKGPPAEHSALESEVELICRLSRLSTRPSTFTLLQPHSEPDQWREALRLVKAGNRQGADVHPQVTCRPTGVVFSLGSYHPFMAKPSYLALAGLPLAQRAAAMRDPATKARILAEDNVAPEYPGRMDALIVSAAILTMDQTYALTTDATYEPQPEENFEALARRAGLPDGRSYLYDHLVGGDGGDFAITYFAGYANRSLDFIREMILDDCTVTGLSDAGAHVGLIFDAVNPTYQLTYWARDRQRGDTLPLAHMIHKQTRRTAKLFGFDDRGLIAPGMRADINVIDFQNLRLGDMSLNHDLPAGGMRLLQSVNGYLATLIDGQLTRRFDKDTGARPGRLLRSRSAKVGAAAPEAVAG